jgi:N-acetylglucosamine transport system permease protein
VKYGQRLFIASFLLPPLAIYAVFVLSPYAQAFYVSMTDWSGLSGTKNWIGFDNYKYLWTFDDEFRRSLVHNGILVLTVPIITVAIALFLAYMLNVGGFRGAGGVRGVGGSKSYKVLYFFPYVLSVSIVAVLWQFIFNPSIGLVNSALRFFGLGNLAPEAGMLGDPNWALTALIIVMIWSGVGFYVVLFSSAMASIPGEIYEAALLDAASPSQTFFRVTLPLLRGSVRTAMVYLAILAMDAFALVHIMTFGRGGGGPDGATQVASNYLYFTAFGGSSRYGLASAMGVVLFFITMVISVVSLVASRRETVEY